MKKTTTFFSLSERASEVSEDTYSMVKIGSVPVRFWSRCPLLRSRASIWKTCSRPPPNPRVQVTVNPFVVWLSTSQFVGGSGGPENVNKTTWLAKNNKVTWWCRNFWPKLNCQLFSRIPICARSENRGKEVFKLNQLNLVSACIQHAKQQRKRVAAILYRLRLL